MLNKKFNKFVDEATLESGFDLQIWYGHFNGMEDIYEYSSIIESLPQVKFVQISYLN